MSAYSDSQSEDGELARSPPAHPHVQRSHDDIDFSLSDEDREPADSLDIKPPQAVVRPSHRERRAIKRSKDRHKDTSRRESKKRLYRQRDIKPEKLKRDLNTKTADRDLVSSKEYYKDKAYYREKDAFREKEMTRQNELYREKDIPREKNIYRDKDVPREKEVSRENELYREKDIPREKNTYREKEVPREKDVPREKEIYREKDAPREKETYREKDVQSEKELYRGKDAPREKETYREKEVMIRDKEIYREKEAYREREQYRERDMYRDNGPYREKEVSRQKESYRDKEIYKDKDIQREREAYINRERMRYSDPERKHKGDMERMEPRSRTLTDENAHKNEKENRDRSTGDKELDDLRTRLLRKYEQGREHMEKDEKSHRNSSLDKIQQERKKRLLEAEREMEKRKQSSRTELEERRKERRRRGAKRSSSPGAAPALDTSAGKRSKLAPPPVADDPDAVVMLSDTSDVEIRSDSPHSDQEEGEHSRTESEAVTSSSGSESESESKSEVEEEEEEEEEEEPHVESEKLTGAMQEQVEKQRSKSPLPRSDPRNSPLSNNVIRSRTRSRSRSHSFSPPPQDENGVQSPEEKTEEDKEEAEKLMNEKINSMPPYFPALQGCRSVEEFQCLNRIEEGTYGVVYRARDKTTEEIVALKRLKMEKEKEGFPITSLREINTLLKGQHPNIVTVREIVVGSNMDKIFIVMDYVEHDLKSLMETMRGKKQVFLPGEVKCLMTQLLEAVHHLHDNWILHRDLKTSNLLLSHKGILKVGDFGLAREYGSPLRPYTPIVVTLWYRAPELLLCCKEYSTHIDMWSVGCIFAEFITMNPLFPGKSEVDQLNRIFKDMGTPSEQVWPGYAQLPAVQKMTFAEHPAGGLRQRVGPDLLSEPGHTLLQAFLNYDPARRITADAALQHPYFKEQPVAIDPAMFPTWPAKSEGGRRAAHSPRPPAGGAFYAHAGDDDSLGFHIAAAAPHPQARSLQLAPGFSLKF